MSTEIHDTAPINNLRNVGRPLIHMRVVGTVSAVVLTVVLDLVASPAEAAVRPKVTIKSSVTSATAGDVVKVTGTVAKRAAGTNVLIQKRHTTGSWRTIGSGNLNEKRSYAVRVKVVAGTNQFRDVVQKSKKAKRAVSKLIKVKGTQVASETETETRSARSLMPTCSACSPAADRLRC